MRIVHHLTAETAPVHINHTNCIKGLLQGVVENSVEVEIKNKYIE